MGRLVTIVGAGIFLIIVIDMFGCGASNEHGAYSSNGGSSGSNSNSSSYPVWSNLTPSAYHQSRAIAAAPTQSPVIYPVEILNGQFAGLYNSVQELTDKQKELNLTNCLVINGSIEVVGYSPCLTVNAIPQ